MSQSNPNSSGRHTAVSPQELREFLKRSFSLGELRELAYDLDIDHEEIPGNTKSEMTRELVNYCERRGWLQALAAQAYKLRPSTPPPHTPGTKYKPGDMYTHYVIGLTNLQDQLGITHTRYSDFLVYQQRLEENITYVRRYGDTPTHRSERSEIIDQLNELALSATGQSFNSLMAK